MSQLQILLEKLHKICESLSELEGEFSELYLTYEGDDFKEQNQLATHLENSIISATHETASNLGFMRIYLIQLTDFIEFRKHYALFNDSELCQIIDNPNFSAKDKLALMKNLNLNQSSLLDLCNEIRQHWNKTFDKSYHKISQQFYAKY